jgi:predicted ATP-dependent protease
MDNRWELTTEQVRRMVDLATLEPAEAGKPEDQTIIGQKRAVRALEFGLGIQEFGFNMYVSGPHGIGKMTAIQAFLGKMARGKEVPPDWCYVNNFEDPYLPTAMKLPAGRGRQLQQDVRHLIEHVRREIPKAFESEEYGARREEIMRALESQRRETVEAFNEKATQAGFVLQVTPFGIALVPVFGNRPLNDAEFQALPAPMRQEMQGKREKLQEELEAAMKQVRAIERASHLKLAESDRKLSLFIVGGVMNDLSERYTDLPEVVKYLGALQTAIVEGIEHFKGIKQAGQDAASANLAAYEQELHFRRYQVNVLVDNGRQEGAPVLVEYNPTYNNLFGRVEKESQFGSLQTDFTLIKPGSLHRANGGYLVVQIEDVLRNPLSWEGLKRTLRSREIPIEDIGERIGYIATKSLRPQPIPLEAKILLVGHPMTHHMLLAYDPDFSELFKVKVDFDTSVDFSPETLREFVSLLMSFTRKASLKNLDPSGIARCVEHSFRMAEDQEKLSTHFGIVADIIREANYWAGEDSASEIGRKHVQKALDERIYRSSLIKERMEEMATRGSLLIETAGAKAGQVNGLTVISLGDFSFGRPVRITASAAPGREGVMDIEREVKLGGPLHSKGVLILNGYLSSRFARQRPLTLSARLVFEQSYQMVEGDSASAAEVFAILSALSGLPIRQGIAVTGSINQKGEVQAIGGINEKIEGFFDLCRERDLDGSQGVLMPRSNVQNLMLREEVAEAVRQQQFHVWAVDHVDQGIEVLTGVAAGAPGEDGHFAEGSVNSLVEKRLGEFAESLRRERRRGAPPAR